MQHAYQGKRKVPFNKPNLCVQQSYLNTLKFCRFFLCTCILAMPTLLQSHVSEALYVSFDISTRFLKKFCKIPLLDGRCININFMHSVVFHFNSFHPVRRLKACEYREPVTCILLNAGKILGPRVTIDPQPHAVQACTCFLIVAVPTDAQSFKVMDKNLTTLLAYV